jgi:sugar/nucleoside kinase (ribokinase family)
MARAAAAQVSWEQIPSGYLADTRHVHFMGSSLTVSQTMRETCYRVAQAVRARGGTVSLDPNLRPELMPVEQIRAVCQPILELAEVVMPSGEELLALTGAESVEAGAAALLARGVRLVALKRGAQGSTLYTAEQALAIPPFSVTEVDPTGAGDCFDAALMVGLLEGWPLENAGLFANAAGALATTRLGPMEGAATRAEVLAFMAAQGRPLLLDA